MIKKIVTLLPKSVWALLVVLFMAACNNNCMDTDPEQTQPIRFYIVDSQGIPFIKKQNTTYQPDSVKLLYQGESLILDTSYDTSYDTSLDSYVFETLSFISRMKGTDAQLLLNLDQTKQDTLDISFRFINAECVSYFVPTTYFFNQNRIYPDLSKAALLKLVKKPD